MEDGGYRESGKKSDMRMREGGHRSYLNSLKQGTFPLGAHRLVEQIP